MTRYAAVIAALGLAVVWNSPASAQQGMRCAERDDALAHLGNKYDEAPVAMGLASNGGVLEVLSSESGSTWTILVTMPNGVSCKIAAGEGFEVVKQRARISTDPQT